MITKTIFLKPTIKLALVVSWNFASILRRFPVISGYPFQLDFLYGALKMADFGRSTHSSWTSFNLASNIHAQVSLRSISRTTHLRTLPPSRDIAHSVHFFGHVTRFHGNRSYGNQNRHFSESAGQTFYKWSILVLFSVSRTVSRYLRFLGETQLRFALLWQVSFRSFVR